MNLNNIHIYTYGNINKYIYKYNFYYFFNFFVKFFLQGSRGLIMVKNLPDKAMTTRGWCLKASLSTIVTVQYLLPQLFRG